MVMGGGALGQPLVPKEPMTNCAEIGAAVGALVGATVGDGGMHAALLDCLKSYQYMCSARACLETGAVLSVTISFMFVRRLRSS